MKTTSTVLALSLSTIAIIFAAGCSSESGSDREAVMVHVRDHDDGVHKTSGTFTCCVDACTPSEECGYGTKNSCQGNYADCVGNGGMFCITNEHGTTCDDKRKAAVE
jgi:hypothetical protein